MARLFEKMVSGSRVLVGSKSGHFGCSLRREFDFRESAVGGKKITAFWWLAFARRRFSGVGSRWERSHIMASFGEKMNFGTRVWWERSHSALVASFGTKLFFGSRALVGSKSQCLGERTASTLFFYLIP